MPPTTGFSASKECSLADAHGLQTLAEKLAWDLSTEYKFDLVSINPSFMLGPAVSAYGTSNSIMEMKVSSLELTTWRSLGL